MALTKKTMVLFDPEQYRELEDIARRERTSVGEIIRRAVKQITLARHSIEARREAARELVAAEEDIGPWEEVEKTMAKGHTP
jgi:Arc/MetJ-type ribon-helix-helix transcriptional regulator